MAIIWRLPWPELFLLFVGVWLCLALEPNDAARLPSDRLVFPSESKPKLESRLKKIDREIAVVSRLMNVTDESLLMMQLEAKNDDNSTRISTGSEPETNSQLPWELLLEPRSIPTILETLPKCKAGYILAAGHCRMKS